MQERAGGAFWLLCAHARIRLFFSAMVGGSTYPSQPGRPAAAALSSEDSVLLKWEAPSRSGGSGIEGYRIEVRTGGAGDFALHIAHTKNPEPSYLVDELVPMTWYEFRCCAINANETGPAGPVSEPILTRGASDMIGGSGYEWKRQLLRSSLGLKDGSHGHEKAAGDDLGGGRRRRTNQQGGTALVREREALAAARAREVQLTGEIDRSIASVAMWDTVFEQRHGRAPTQDDRDESRVLRDEAHTMRVLRHSLADAKVASIRAEGSVLIKERLVAKKAIKSWTQQHIAITGEEPTDEDREADPKITILPVSYTHLTLPTILLV